MIKRINAVCILLSSVSLAHAGAPLTLSPPSPAIPSSLSAGDQSSYTYTISNNTNKNIPVSQTITGNSTNATITTSCTTVPAAGTCQFVITLTAAVRDFLLPNGIVDTVSVNYSGRLPSKITSTIQTQVEIPALNTLTVNSSAIRYDGTGSVDPAGTPTTLGNGYVTYTATATTNTGVILDVTPIVTWSSSNPDVALAPDSNGHAITFTPGGAGATTNIWATYQTLSTAGNPSPLMVNTRFYVSTPLGGTTNSGMSPVLCQLINASTGTPSICNLVNNPYSGITYTAINSDARFIYMANLTGSIYSCSLNAYTGQYATPETCSQISINSGGSSNRIATVKLSPNNKFLYALTPSGIYTCQVTQATGAVNGCALQTTNAQVRAFAIDPNGLYMYLISNPSVSPYAQSCSINQSTGALSNCVNQSPTGISSTYTTSDLAAVSTTDGTFLYGPAFIAGGARDGSVLVCQANADTGSISSCSYPVVNVPGGLIANPYGVSVSSTRTGPFQLYIGEIDTGGVDNCAINSDFNSFGICYAINTLRNNAGVLIR